MKEKEEWKKMRVYCAYKAKNVRLSKWTTRSKVKFDFYTYWVIFDKNLKPRLYLVVMYTLTNGSLVYQMKV